jgi:membrane protein DedA with SNARE-associated domain
MAERRALRWTLVALALLALVIIPFVVWEQQLAAWSEGLLASAGRRVVLAAAVTLLLALDVVLPIPSSLVAAAAVVVLGYALGRIGGRALVRRVVGDRELGHAERLSERLGSAVLVVSRGVPVLAEASALLAGSLAMPFARFALVVGASNLGLSLAYAVLSGQGWFEGPRFLLPFALGILVPALALVVLRLVERRG